MTHRGLAHRVDAVLIPSNSPLFSQPRTLSGDTRYRPATSRTVRPANARTVSGINRALSACGFIDICSLFSLIDESHVDSSLPQLPQKHPFQEPVLGLAGGNQAGQENWGIVRCQGLVAHADYLSPMLRSVGNNERTQGRKNKKAGFLARKPALKK
jgi:hypothetical protein